MITSALLTPAEQLQQARKDYTQAEIWFNLAEPGPQQDAAYMAMQEAKARMVDALQRARVEQIARRRSA